MNRFLVFSILIFFGVITNSQECGKTLSDTGKGIISEGNLSASFDKSVVYKTAILPVTFKVSESNESVRFTAASNIRRNILGISQFNLIGEKTVKEAWNTVPDGDETALVQYLAADAVVTCLISQESEGMPYRADVEIRTASGNVIYSGRGRGKTFISLEADSEIAIQLAIKPLREKLGLK